MTLPDSSRKEMDAMPPVLLALLEAELAAGNSIAEIGHSFPAPPVGAYFKLAHTLLSRPRASGEGIDYYDRNHSGYSGEITDAKRHFFLLEPPAPPEPEPNMDDIRVAHVPDDTIPDGEFQRVQALKKILHPAAVSTTAANAFHDTSVVGRFRRSMVMDYDKWHDGTGYDLSLIKSATADERAQIETILINRSACDWRDIEALAALDSPASQAALKMALTSSKHEISMSALNYAPELVPDATRVRMLVAALRNADFHGGLSGALAQVETFHPPEIIDELFHGALERPGDVGVHFAAMLMFLHGKAASAFDWAQRPFFLRFNTTHRSEREAAFIELCGKIGAPAAGFAQQVRAAPRNA